MTKFCINIIYIHTPLMYIIRINTSIKPRETDTNFYPNRLFRRIDMYFSSFFFTLVYPSAYKHMQ